MTDDITQFTGQYRFLSNFWPSPVVLDGVVYPTVEHAYQAAKSHDPAFRQRVLACTAPGQAKALGRAAPLRPDWESVRLQIMADLVWLKFQHPDLRRALIATAGRRLVEGNDWGDKFWGCVRGIGQNHLGKILMNVREHLIRAEQAP